LEAEVVYYEPIPEWVTGMGIVQFKQAVKLNSPKRETTIGTKR
jgi:2,3-dihydroxyphenylpropionate 1,2-dioxygenase